MNKTERGKLEGGTYTEETEQRENTHNSEKLKRAQQTEHNSADNNQNNMRRFSCLNGCLQTHTFEHSVKQTSCLLTIFTFIFVFSPWVGVIQSSEDSKEIHLIPQCQ